MTISQLRRAAGALVLLALIPLGASADPLDRNAQRVQFREALASAATPSSDAWKPLSAQLEKENYPLTAYIELAALRPRIGQLPRSEVERFLDRWSDSLAASDLREAYLRELARRKEWTTFRALWKDHSARDLQCLELQARLSGGAKLDYSKDLAALWEGATALPGTCDVVVLAARRSGVLDDSHVRERFDRSAASGSASAAAQAATLLDGAERVAADRIVAAIRDPATTLGKAKTWTDDVHTRDAVSYGLARYARRNSSAAETAWADLQGRFKWDPAQKNRILNAIALYRSTSYSDDAMARLKALPDEADDDATREWRVRVTLAKGDFAATLAALDRLSNTQKSDERWRYLRARVLMKLDRKAEAAPLFAEVAREANFHGFLAADWSEQPYTICPSTLAQDASAAADIAAMIDLQRAFEFRELNMLPEARREWGFAMTKLDETKRQLAADLAYQRGWYDRAVFAFSAKPDTQRLYEQRFPIGMETHVKQEARGVGIDPAWAYAIIRAESAWMTDARSSADAYGLMQLLPGVAKEMAKAEGLPYSAPRDLFNPELNVQLGTRFLGKMARQYSGSPWLASAAYNAGGVPVKRWLTARGSLDPDFFIETIPYKETRDYVARVLAFSVIYDWRLNGKVLALSSRMPPIGQPYQSPDAQTPRKNVICAAAQSAVTTAP